MTRGDLYAAFILRCMELADLGGKVAMVTQQSFMFISSYGDLRMKLRAALAVETMTHLGPRAFPNITGEKVNTTAFICEKWGSKRDCDSQIGVYFRLVREPDADSKRQAFEAGLEAIRAVQPHQLLFRYLQVDFDAVTSAPWAYFLTNRLRKLFETLPPLSNFVKLCIGMRTGDDARFLRKWWEVGINRFQRDCQSASEASESGRRWFPYMKGGGSARWYGQQELVVDWANNGRLIKQATKQKYPELGDKLGWKITNEPFYFRKGVTWSNLSSDRFSVRLSQGGFIFSTKGSSAFCDDPIGLLALLNSSFVQYALRLINPTVSFEVTDLSKIPYPGVIPASLRDLAEESIKLKRQDSAEQERTFYLVSPLRCLEDLTSRREKAAALEAEIDAKVSRLYGLSEEDLGAITGELSGASTGESDDEADNQGANGDEEDEADGDFARADLARCWVSYAIGTVLGRFEIGKPGSLGCGDFAAATVTAIRALIDPDGIIPCDEGHAQDIAARVEKCLALMLRANAVATVLAGC